MKLKQIFGFKSAISFLDFSTDNQYMQVEDKIGEVTLYEIDTDRPIKTDAIDFELEWLGDGLRTYSRLKGVRHQYNANNKIVKIKKGRIYEEMREKDSGRGKEKGGVRVRTEKNLGCGERETEKG